MKRAYFTIVWNRGTPEVDACLDLDVLDDHGGTQLDNFMVVCERLKNTEHPLYQQAKGVLRSMAAIDLRMRFNPHQEGPFIVWSTADLLSREVLDGTIADYSRTGELEDWLNKARVNSPAGMVRAG